MNEKLMLCSYTYPVAPSPFGEQDLGLEAFLQGVLLFLETQCLLMDLFM